MNQWKGENDRRKYFMVNVHESMWPDQVRKLVPLALQSDVFPTAWQPLHKSACKPVQICLVQTLLNVNMQAALNMHTLQVS